VGDGIRTAVAKDAQQSGVVAQIGFDEGEIIMREEVAEVAVFVEAGVVGVEIVEADDGIATVEQGFGNAGADEAGGAGDEDEH
jgi:hypothetical protein